MWNVFSRAFADRVAEKWQENADGWRAVGEWPRARWCQERADYWRQSFWQRFFGPHPPLNNKPALLHSQEK